jgi:hypothetical protein
MLAPMNYGAASSAPMRERVLKIGMIVGVVNFGVFWVVALIIGGDAWNGRSGFGHYFLGNHGKLTEVNAVVFWYSRCHALSLIVTHPLAMICGFLWNREKDRATSSAAKSSKLV